MEGCRDQIRMELLISTGSVAGKAAFIGRLPPFTKVIKKFDDHSVVVSTYRPKAMGHLCKQLGVTCGIVAYDTPPDAIFMANRLQYLQRLCGKTKARRKRRILSYHRII
ncbi:hypothetical protein KAR91_28570 [Candidatus Pacearchaeota archaeon]|nr:hypothetical protein [Candidatus Pacearchaeota archaeon]